MGAVFSGLSWRLRASLEIMRARKQSRVRLARKNLRNVLIVCHGNIYRSPVVAELLKARLDSCYSVRSAGFHPSPGRPCPGQHITMAMSKGVNLAHHRSSVITFVDLAWADIIILMDVPNWVRVCRMGADPNKLVWLGALGRGRIEIEDPYGRSADFGAAIIDRLIECSELLELHLGATSNR